MKILFISMPSVHVVRWIENLKDTNYELYWFDVLGRGKLETLDSVHQFTNWEKRKLPYIKGEYFLSKKVPLLYEKVVSFLKLTANEVLEQIINEVQPDVVHSFEMQGCNYPIVTAMEKYPNIKWLYSCWGNDLFYYQQFPEHSKKIKRVLQRVNYLHTDCERDSILAKQMGFAGKHLGVIPGGTGYKIQELAKYKRPITNRKIILVKGYEHAFGRGLNVIKALQFIPNTLNDNEVVVFGAHPIVIDYIVTNNLPYKYCTRHELSHDALLELMGQTLLYIGNSISDGMPNTLLEAIVMGAFPIQSNPGGVTQEIITDGVNGFLIENPESVIEIKEIIVKGLSSSELFQNASERNEKLSCERLDYELNRVKVISLYNSIKQCE